MHRFGKCGKIRSGGWGRSQVWAGFWTTFWPILRKRTKRKGIPLPHIKRSVIICKHLTLQKPLLWCAQNEDRLSHLTKSTAESTPSETIFFSPPGLHPVPVNSCLLTCMSCVNLMYKLSIVNEYRLLQSIPSSCDFFVCLFHYIAIQKTWQVGIDFTFSADLKKKKSEVV